MGHSGLNWEQYWVMTGFRWIRWVFFPSRVGHGFNWVSKWAVIGWSDRVGSCVAVSVAVVVAVVVVVVVVVAVVAVVAVVVVILGRRRAGVVSMRRHNVGDRIVGVDAAD